MQVKEATNKATLRERAGLFKEIHNACNVKKYKTLFIQRDSYEIFLCISSYTLAYIMPMNTFKNNIR